MKNAFPFSVMVCCMFALSCSNEKTAEAIPEKACDLDSFLVAYIDSGVKPQDDFFKYSMGKWEKDNPIPKNEESWGIWKMVNEETYARLKAINEEAVSKDAPAGSDWRKIRDYWAAAMDTNAIEKGGIGPLQADLDRIAGIKDLNELVAEAGRLQSIGVSTLLNRLVMQDQKNSEKMAVYIWQGGLGLPERDFYFEQDARTQHIRKEYAKHLRKMFMLMGNDSVAAEKSASTVMNIETDLAEKSRKLADLRDPNRNYNKMELAGLRKLAPSMDWNDFFTKSGIPSVDTVIVGQPEFLSRVDASLKKYPLAEWKTYLSWGLINAFAEHLSSAFDKEHFHFYGTIIAGAKEQRPRWKRMLDQQGQQIGFMLGKLYIERYYTPTIKARYDRMVDDVLSAYHDRIDALAWMSDSTKKKAHGKLNALTRKVGYPEKWRDYSSLEIDGSSLVRNVMHANRWLTAYQVSKLGKPIDRSEWYMTPQTWNAYYNPSNNEIVLPAAAFIVPGLADSCVDDAIMYGYAAGSTIGHEITHGFDDEGSQYDEKGNLREWWSKEDRKKFNALTKGIVDQFNGYTLSTGEHLNGDAEQGENIADLGGMLLGLDAFKKTKQFKEGKSIGGFTPLQRYFFGFALSWYGKVRDEYLQTLVKVDVHAPNFWRVNGPVTNVDAFYEAFQIKPGDKMFVPAEKRVRIW